LHHVFFVDTRNGWAVGDNGFITHTVNGGNTWEQQTAIKSPPTNIPPMTGGGVGGTSEFGQTTDPTGGTTTQQPGSLPSSTSKIDDNLYTVFFADVKNGWALGDKGLVIVTTDGGTTWVQKLDTSGNTYQGRDMFFVDANNGWRINNYSILHTNNGGETWNYQVRDTMKILYGISFVNANNGWAVGNNGFITHTEDGISLNEKPPSTSCLFVLWSIPNVGFVMYS